MSTTKLAILGCGNIGSAIAKGLAKSGMAPGNITLTRRKSESLTELNQAGFQTTADNVSAVQNSEIILLSVGPSQLMDLLDEISQSLSENHLLISIVSGVSISEIQAKVGKEIPIIRAMPNTAAALCESMTCLSSLSQFTQGLKTAQSLFENVGKT